MSDFEFKGKIGATWQESTPWWPDAVRPRDGAPNIVLVLYDDVGFGSFGCYGAEIATPTMDHLASEGLRYNNFHVTPLCSPTRASLLTGRNHHSVGMAFLANADSGFPGTRGHVSKQAATLAEMLRASGYNTMCVGKWHVAPIDQTSAAGPYDQWPLGRGFERYYGFLDALTDHFYPDLVHDNHRVDPPKTPQEGYHLTEDLIDHAIGFVRDQVSASGEKPFFAYLAFGAAHCPHQAPQAFLDKYRGRYDEGWDVVRERRHQRQLELGIIPPGTTLAPRNAGVQPWDSLSADEKKVSARLQEAFAAMVDHTDHELGRFVDYLKEIGKFDNTIFVILADNGASQEGGAGGTTNIVAYENGNQPDLAYNLARLEQIGGPRSQTNYPQGWAQVGNTPLRRYKQNTHAGGVRAPLIVSWRDGLKARGGVRQQFHHVIDIAPTLLDLAGIQPPQVYNGVPQMPVHGVSMRYSFEDAAAPTRRQTQYFEMFTHRAIWHDGWKAVSFHQRGNSYDQDTWELFNLDEDFSECNDLAAKHPEKLKELVGRWWAEAGRFGVLPLDDRGFPERAVKYQSHGSPRLRTRLVLYPGMARIPSGAAPLVINRSFRITARLADIAQAPQGVLVSLGDLSGGFTMYVQGGRLCFEYNHEGTPFRIESAAGAVTAQSRTLEFAFERTADYQGVGRVFVDGKQVGEGVIPRSARWFISWSALDVGRDSLSRVSDAYSDEFAFTPGALERVEIELEPMQHPVDHQPMD
ncbi:arylsulfatase [Ramlibacter albus]|uniref:Arylsulfatase n=1 Tax=Ramlibacter albus TaxID=2079448 RepID=A0A923MDN0_9BURK|nr:arylsulfatase [Ramlibacter albus]MBC5767117.1 arylsulfatase [Ramlibacter albus]